MTILHNPPPPGLEPVEDIFSQAIRLTFAPSQRIGHLMRVLNAMYWGAVLFVLAWVFSMAIDRTVPVEIGPRVVVNHQVHPGERLLVSSTRNRTRQCEMSRRWYVVDGSGRRIDYEPEHFDAYGPLTPPGEPPEREATGPVIPLDAMPGKAKWISTLAWDCNPLQRALGWSIVLVQAPVEFQIVR
ncbi:hypothetical protein ASF28_08830 [Methylobacterium sp. Leaf99]|uniref:hypothetical protein n=1 Tax=Methylobacterium sp. Leaf99 TaxID=1736251 RepID=UPI0006FCAA9F|nr:hypothetical protein [Methylobacterium sp. Leaf99]KQP11138.1 hypothetical protein ASF28_08830 [Methylobacterium sp. Leaf99]